MELRRYGGIVLDNLNRVCTSLLNVCLDLTYKQANQYSHTQYETNLAEGIENSTTYTQFSTRYFRKRHVGEALGTQTHTGADNNATPGSVQGRRVSVERRKCEEAHSK